MNKTIIKHVCIGLMLVVILWGLAACSSNDTGEKETQNGSGEGQETQISFMRGPVTIGRLVESPLKDLNDKYTIKTVTFKDTLEGASDDALDVSENADGSVLAWVEGEELCIAADGKIGITDASICFEGFDSLEKINFNGCFDTSKTTEMSAMFDSCAKLKEIDLSDFNTENVTNMVFMFAGCRELERLDLSSFNTGNVTNMCGMFDGCSALESLDLSSFDTGNVTDMSRMFEDCSELERLDLSSFDTGNVTNMMSMFLRCSALESLDVSNFNTENVTQMDAMFADCSTLKILDVSNFNTENVTLMASMFAGCSSLESLDISSFGITDLSKYSKMFGEGFNADANIIY